jgi:hypothetical protein
MELLERLAGATPKQQEFIADLLASRQYELGDTLIDSPRAASNLISELMMAPYKAIQGTDTELFEALSSVQKSKYAIPTSELILDFYTERIDSELLFIEVKEHRSRLQIRRLHGAVGDFTRTRMTRQDSLSILRHIAQDTYKYTKLFGEHFVCCGKCSAPLTDDTSRRIQLGPDCRKAFGF